MDLRVYYQKLRKIESQIARPYVIVTSNETPDGGVPGRMTETSREQAAKLIVDGRARLSTEEEEAVYRAEAAAAKRAAEQRALASRIQIAVVSDSELRSLKDNAKPKAGKE